MCVFIMWFCFLFLCFGSYGLSKKEMEQLKKLDKHLDEAIKLQKKILKKIKGEQ